jgi:hypothetical protein
MDREEAVRRGFITVPSQPLPQAFWGQCGRKIAHVEFSAAVSHAVKLAKEKPEKDRKVRIYRCQYGAHWHVGHITHVNWSNFVSKSTLKELENKFKIISKELIDSRLAHKLWKDKHEAQLTRERRRENQFPRINKFLLRFGLLLHKK